MASDQAAKDQAHNHIDCTEDHPNPMRAGLTRNERLVLDALSANDGPMKAYQLLEALKDHGIKAPMTVYRALDRLEAKGKIHKLDAINAFMICNHDTPHAVQIFLVCTSCDKVSEVADQGSQIFDMDAIRNVAAPHQFGAQGARIEIRGPCQACR